MHTKGNTGLSVMIGIGVLLLIYLLIQTIRGSVVGDTASKQATVQTEEKKGSPSMNIDIKKQYSAVLHTDKGDITLALTAEKTPVTVNNFVTLAENKFYDGTIFHRTINNFMIQGGDPKGDGTGGPGYTFDDEPFEGKYVRGTIAMANRGPNTNGSQFFIMHQDYDLLPNYVIFGAVTKGLDVVDAIATAPVKKSATGESSVPATPVHITSVEIIAQ